MTGTTVACVTSVRHDTRDPFERFSSLLRLQKVVATCLKFIRRVDKKGRLTADELDVAFLRCAYWAQQSCFHHLKTQSTVRKGSPLRNLTIMAFWESVGDFKKLRFPTLSDTLLFS